MLCGAVAADISAITWMHLIARAQIGIGELPRRQTGERRRIAAPPPGPDQAAQQDNERELKQETQIRRRATELSDQTVAEQQAEHAGAKKSRREAADHAGPAEQAAERAALLAGHGLPCHGVIKCDKLARTNQRRQENATWRVRIGLALPARVGVLGAKQEREAQRGERCK